MAHNTKTHEQPALFEHSDDGGATTKVTRSVPPKLPVQRPTTPMEHVELWTIEDVANYLGVPKQTVYAWRTSGYGPQGFRVGKHVRWRASTVIAWTLGLERGDN
ncbi:excisionase family DNA binding protein [Nocardioides cavernae]|uniref:Excisionase family DNA binding protein n=1 Tax=Nocardioides cavernae TaxID=1921566 RepID=A0A7Y9KQA4_9ACTN|nr:helix-turn-helix domain-containing protein [Nocardioides cavernae]NYE35380.1 excisionase family DNA binding protein [Nocardioides cavernae]